mmetsp:Transcript_70712/g.210867  ORF Transcript_70712/g.210867 Transcript_70712/m.210867 type:complete len:246 (+) Transcript_70712:117-854(+)
MLGTVDLALGHKAAWRVKARTCPHLQCNPRPLLHAPSMGPLARSVGAKTMATRGGTRSLRPLAVASQAEGEVPVPPRAGRLVSSRHRRGSVACNGTVSARYSNSLEGWKLNAKRQLPRAYTIALSSSLLTRTLCVGQECHFAASAARFSATSKACIWLNLSSSLSASSNLIREHSSLKPLPIRGMSTQSIMANSVPIQVKMESPPSDAVNSLSSFRTERPRWTRTSPSETLMLKQRSRSRPLASG